MDMRDLLKKISALLLSLTILLSMFFGVCVIVNAQESNGIYVLYTNEIHCGINNYSVLAAYRSDLIGQGYDVVTVDAGDAIQGEMIGTLTEGASVVDIMNEVGYDYAVPGNHEFDYKVARLLEIANNEAEYEYLSANFYDLLTDKTVFKPYAIKKFGDEKIAFLGLSTPETYGKSSPAYFQDENGNFIYGFCGDDFYSVIQNAVDSALSEGATKVIAVAHLGISGVTEGWRSVDLIKNTVGIDVLIDGHAHETIEKMLVKNKDGDNVVLTSTGTKFTDFGVLKISNDGSFITKLVSPDSVDVDSLSDEAKTAYNTVKSKIDDYNAEFNYLFEEIGVSEAHLCQNDENGNRLVRKTETNLGDFVTDAYKAVTGADIAFVNGGGLRADIMEGAVNRKAIMDVNPWNNEMCVIEATGQQIFDALEYGVYATPNEFGSFPHVSGITFEVHTYIETPVVVDEQGDFVSIKENALRRVANVKINGKPIDLTKKYTIAGSCYMLQLGGYKMFSGAKTVVFDGPTTDAEMLMMYFTDYLDGKITAEKYGNINGDGRIVTVNEKPNKPETEVPDAGDESALILWFFIAFISFIGAKSIFEKRI